VIVGIGIDVCEVSRIQAAIERFGDRFIRRIYTPAEINYCQSKKNAVERFAGRFAAKEAATKAIGTGLHFGVTWQDVEISRLPGGRPTVLFHRAAAQHFARLGAKDAHLSITHSGDLAVAQVIIES
jgi:holo-[acyl-carrier protein] synthase